MLSQSPALKNSSPVPVKLFPMRLPREALPLCDLCQSFSNYPDLFSQAGRHGAKTGDTLR